MKIVRALLLANTVVGVCAFAPPSIAREPSSFVVRIDADDATRETKSSSSALQVAASNVAVSDDPTRRLKVGYKWLSKRNYLQLAFVQAAVLASGADIATQTMEHGSASLDMSHVAAMATVASTMSGAFNAVCLRKLEDEFPGKEKQNIVIKTVIHAVIIASIINSAYLAFVPMLANDIYHGAGLPQSNPFEAWNLDDFITLTKLEIAMFIPYNALAFTFVPPQVRPLTHAAISASFNIAVSAVTLGYFDVWCQRAMDMLG